MILFGLDPSAARLAGALAARAAAERPGWPAVHLFTPADAPVAGLRRYLAGVMEAAQERGEPFEARLACLLTTSAREAEAGLDTLRGAREVLETLAAGNQTVALVALVPAPDARDAEKRRAFQTFLALEDLVGELPFLDVVFVNQLASGPERGGDGGVDEVAGTLLARELLDPDLRGVIASFAHPAVGGRARVAGRRACYSTLGTYRLVYRADAARAHVVGRFQHELLARGLLAPALLDENVSVALQARVDELTRGRLEAIVERLSATPAVALGELAEVPESAALRERVAAVPEEAARALDRVAPQIVGLGDLLEGWARRALLDFLPGCPAHLAGAVAFVEAMRRERVAGDTSVPSGARWLWRELCDGPLERVMADVVEPHLRTAAAAIGAELPPPWRGTVALEWLAQVAEACETAARGSLAGGPIRLLAAAVRDLRGCVGEAAATGPAAAGVVAALGNAFRDEASADLDRMAENRQARAASQRALARLRWSFGPISSFVSRRAEFAAARAELHAKLAKLDGDYEVLRRAFAHECAIFLALLNEVALPHLVRRRIGERVLQDADDVAAEMAGFVERVVQEVDARLARAPSGGGERGPTGADLLTGTRLEALYRRTLERGQVAFPEAVEAMLAFLPEPPGAAGARRVSYRECHGLRDHYLRGPETLLDRMAEHADHLAAWLLELDALDVVECEGPQAADAFLADVVERSRRFLELSSGMVARVQGEGCPRVLFVVRASAEAGARLANVYGRLFVPECRLVDSGDPRAIEVTSLTVGFPAFLVHVLHEGRRLALEGEGAGCGDLWPA